MAKNQLSLLLPHCQRLWPSARPLPGATLSVSLLQTTPLFLQNTTTSFPSPLQPPTTNTGKHFPFSLKNSLKTRKQPNPSSKATMPTLTCKKSTFLNSRSQKLASYIYKNSSSYEACNTRAPDTALDYEMDSSVFGGKSHEHDSHSDGFSGLKKGVTVKILSYNVFREDQEMHKRMKAIGDLIQLHSPDVICFQEVTPKIYDIFCQSSWWKAYHCSHSNEMAASKPFFFCMQLSKLPVKSFNCKPFRKSIIVVKEFCFAEVGVEGDKDKPLVVATSHLASPCPGPLSWHMSKKKRQAEEAFIKKIKKAKRLHQAKKCFELLPRNPNVIFCGDMSWDEKLDGKFPLPDGWVDAWTELRPGENDWIYDT